MGIIYDGIKELINSFSGLEKTVIYILFALLIIVIILAIKRNKLFSLSDDMLSTIQSEKLIFGETNSKFQYYYRENEFEDNDCAIKLSKYDTIIVGEPASGKTELLRNYFVKSNNKIKRIYALSLFYSSKDIIELITIKDKKSELISAITNNLFYRYYIFFDGIDEIANKDYFKDFCELVKEIKRSQNKTRIMISVRKKFYDDNKICNNEDLKKMKVVSMREWSVNDLVEMGRKLVLGGNYGTDEKTNRVLNALDNLKENYKLIRTPLLLKMYVYVLLYGEEESINLVKRNRFELYKNFSTILLSRQGYDKGKNIFVICKEAYESYVNGTRVIDCKYNDTSIFKKNKTMVHETLFEFFVAWNYFNSITEREFNKIDINGIGALSRGYQNEYADFISDALNSLNENEKKTVLNNLCGLYYFTLPKTFRDNYIMLFDNNVINIKKIVNKFSKIEEYLNELSEEDYFTLKTQIVFRFGRLSVDEEQKRKIISVLNYLYDNDSCNLRQDSNYFDIVLRRGCAISASFLGAEKIEIDYVDHMLNYNERDYIVDYDLANRSHTLIFYGDVESDCTLFNFKDDNKVDCTKSLQKRIKRLKKKLIPEISDMSPEEKKIYYFRLFDLATVYSFIISRGGKILNEEDKGILKNCEVYFEGASYKREELMKGIKGKILELIDK